LQELISGEQAAYEALLSEAESYNALREGRARAAHAEALASVEARNAERVRAAMHTGHAGVLLSLNGCARDEVRSDRLRASANERFIGPHHGAFMRHFTVILAVLGLCDAILGVSASIPLNRETPLTLPCTRTHTLGGKVRAGLSGGA
jgi:hypothetical protein